MRDRIIAHALRLARLPTTVWLFGLGLVFLIRFPVKFMLDPPYLMDLQLFRVIALRVLEGNAIYLYAPAGTAQGLFKYAPSLAVLMAPLGWVSAHAAAVLWSGLNVVWLIALCWFSDRLCRILGLRPLSLLAVPTVLLLVRPITSEFLLGQTNLLWGMLIAGAILFNVTQRPWRAALFFALATSLKLPALIFWAYFALRRHWQMLGRTLACFTAVNILAALALAPSNPLQFFSAWMHNLITSGPDRAFEIGNQSFLSLVGRLLRDDGFGFNLLALSDPTVIAVAGVLQVLLFVTLFHRGASRLAAPDRMIIDGALLSTMMVLFSPTSWVATYSALLFPCMLALALLMDRPQEFWTHRSLAVGVLLAGAMSLMTHSKFWRFVKMTHIKGETYVYLVLMILPLLGLSLLWCLWHQRAAAGSSQLPHRQQ